MDVNIVKQISDLHDLQSKVMNICGDYKDINIANAALQICSHYGLDETSKIISDLRLSPLNINDSEKLKSILKKCSNFIIPTSLINNNDDYSCPTCSNKIDKNNDFKYCPYCGQNINNKVVNNNATDDN